VNPMVAGADGSRKTTQLLLCDKCVHGVGAVFVVLVRGEAQTGIQGR
jgi:hypothetical protein